jgi:hypothetical protein
MVFEDLIVFKCFVFYAHKVETHKRKRSTCGAKFSSFKEEAYTITASFKEAFTKYGS